MDLDPVSVRATNRILDAKFAFAQTEKLKLAIMISVFAQVKKYLDT